MRTLRILMIIMIFSGLQIYAKSSVNETRALSGNGKVYIDNISGSVTVKGWEKNEVSIKGNYGNGIDRVDIQSTSNSITINVIYKFGWIFDNKCDLDIDAPYKCYLNIDTVSAKITVDDFKEEASIQSVSGDIKITGNFKNLEVKSTSGDLKIDGDNDNIELKTTSGDIDIKGIGNDIDITSISGDLTLDGKYLRIKTKTVSGDINYNGKEINSGDFHSTSGTLSIECTPQVKADINAETTSGRIDLTTPKNLSAKLRLESFSGRIKIAGINYNKEVDDEENDFIEISKSIKMTIGTGDSKIYLQSLSGNITLNGK